MRGERSRVAILIIITAILHRGEAIGCYHCISTSMHRNEDCELGKRSSHYYDQCIPEGEPSNSMDGQIYCSKVIGSSYGDMGDRIVVRGCTYYPRNECRESISVRGKTIRGCIYTCNSGNYCNKSTRNIPSTASIVLLLTMTATTSMAIFASGF